MAFLHGGQSQDAKQWENFQYISTNYARNCRVLNKKYQSWCFACSSAM